MSQMTWPALAHYTRIEKRPTETTEASRGNAREYAHSQQLSRVLGSKRGYVLLSSRHFLAEAISVHTSGQLHVQKVVPAPYPAYTDRIGAGDALVAWIRPAEDPEAVVLALPRGGVPVAKALAGALGCDIRPILVRKLPVPWSPELGFGVITIDGTITLNDSIVREFGIDQATIERVAARTLAEIERRRNTYPGSWPLPHLTSRHVWLVDDGLATGFTAVGAARMIRAQECAHLSLAVPCGPLDTAEMLTHEVDDVWCAIAQEQGSFAVATFYRDFHGMSDAEVIELLSCSPS